MFKRPRFSSFFWAVMLSTTVCLTLSLTLSLTVGSTVASAFIRTVELLPEELFVPYGYDSNDEVVLVIEGRLPDTCHQLSTAEILKNEETRTIEIKPMAVVNPGPCFRAPIPWDKEVQLGTLSVGEWRVISGGQTKTLSVGQPNSTDPDDFLYAPISAAIVRTDSNGRLVAELRGRLLASCLSLQEIRVLDQGAVTVLLPILAQSGETCDAVSTDFSQTVELPQGLVSGRHLLHVRSLNGRAVNVIFQVP
jgi:hypothetical protein